MLRTTILALSVAFTLSGCTSVPIQEPEVLSESVLSATAEADVAEPQPTAPVESCKALEELTIFLDGQKGYGDDGTLTAWIVGLKNRFDEDSESELFGELDAFRISISELFQTIKSYGVGSDALGVYQERSEVRPQIRQSLIQLSLELNYLLSECSLSSELLMGEDLAIELPDFWEQGYWIDGTSQNSLGDTTIRFSQVYFDEASEVWVTVNFFCIAWVDEEPFMQIAAFDSVRNLAVKQVTDGAIRARIDTRATVNWVGDFAYPFFYKLRDDQLVLLKGSERLALQMFVERDLFDFSLDTRGFDLVLERFQAAGCKP